MDNDQTTGVTEARFALTLVICVLVAIGYIVLLRLSGTSNHSPIEIQTEVVEKPPVPTADPTLPHVLPVESQGPSASIPWEIATRPESTPGPDATPR